MIWHFYDVFIAQGQCLTRKKNRAILQWAIMGISKIRDFQEPSFVFLLLVIHCRELHWCSCISYSPFVCSIEEKCHFLTSGCKPEVAEAWSEQHTCHSAPCSGLFSSGALNSVPNSSSPRYPGHNHPISLMSVPDIWNVLKRIRQKMGEVIF